MRVDPKKLSKKKLRAALYWANITNKEQATRITQLEEACKSYERSIDRWELDLLKREGLL